MKKDKEALNHTSNGVQPIRAVPDGPSKKKLVLDLTPDEAKLLTSLASDQLFRKEFIDPKMPGFRPNPGEMSMGKSILGRLRLLVEQGSPKKLPAAKAAR